MDVDSRILATTDLILQQLTLPQLGQFCLALSLGMGDNQKQRCESFPWFGKVSRFFMDGDNLSIDVEKAVNEVLRERLKHA